MAPKQQTPIASFSKQTTQRAPHASPLSVLPKPSMQILLLHRASFFINKAGKRPSNQQHHGSERENYRATVSKRTGEFYNFLGTSSSFGSCQSEDQKERSCLQGSSSQRRYDFLSVESNPKHCDILGVPHHPSDYKRKRKESDRENNNEVSTDLKLSLYEPVNCLAKREFSNQAERELEESELLGVSLELTLCCGNSNNAHMLADS